jgi:hypothetical protein
VARNSTCLGPRSRRTGTMLHSDALSTIAINTLARASVAARWLTASGWAVSAISGGAHPNVGLARNGFCQLAPRRGQILPKGVRAPGMV